MTITQAQIDAADAYYAACGGGHRSLPDNFTWQGLWAAMQAAAPASTDLTTLNALLDEVEETKAALKKFPGNTRLKDLLAALKEKIVTMQVAAPATCPPVPPRPKYNLNEFTSLVGRCEIKGPREDVEHICKIIVSDASATLRDGAVRNMWNEAHGIPRPDGEKADPK